MLNLPETLRAALAQAGEEYLAGLSNKGTVNRGKKDLSGLTPAATPDGETVRVALGDVECVIRAPLGDSGCSCPAQGMCRHRVAAILWLKTQSQDGGCSGPSEAPPPDLSPLLEVPADQIRKAMGAKNFHSLLFRLGRDGLPAISEGSIVQVELPDAAVKLLTPLEHSSCTCRSRELCRHKAAALLCYQLKKERHTLEELAGPTKTSESRWDPEQVSAAALAVRELAAGILDNGLSRLSPGAPDSAQRLSALCHTANLPRLENGLRSLSTLLERALKRSAAFRTEDLLLRLAELNHQAKALEAPDADLPSLAGSFRDEYLPCPPLFLSLLGERQFHSDSGFAGTVYYFWELNQRRWYTYTIARPTFYEGRGRRRPPSRNPAPWGLLDCLMDQLYNLTLSLDHGKATADRRLSSSEESRGTVGANGKPWEVFPPELCWTDFSAMFQYLEPYLLEGPETDRVVFLRPAACKTEAFDKVNQQFRMTLSDSAGRTVPLEVRYRAEAKSLVQTLEALSKNIEEHPGGVFLALARLSGENLSLYPIEYYSEWGCGA